jgi:hypothetical protein
MLEQGSAPCITPDLRASLSLYPLRMAKKRLTARNYRQVAMSRELPAEISGIRPYCSVRRKSSLNGLGPKSKCRAKCYLRTSPHGPIDVLNFGARCRSIRGMIVVPIEGQKSGLSPLLCDCRKGITAPAPVGFHSVSPKANISFTLPFLYHWRGTNGSISLSRSVRPDSCTISRRIQAAHRGGFRSGRSKAAPIGKSIP